VSTASARVGAVGAGAIARVRVGPFAQRPHAVAKLKELEGKGVRGGIVVAESRE
jgi:cell division protein FtsN